MAVVKNTYVEEETFVNEICVQPKHPFSYNIAHCNDSDKNEDNKAPTQTLCHSLN